jgi:hypothetical protein
MKNPKTTWGGILLVVAAIATAAGHFLTGNGLGMSDIQAIITAVTALVGGLSLIGAADGGA